VPGTASIHGGFQWGGQQVVDMGDWLPMSTSAALQCWSLVWGDGPALWSVDPSTVETAWARYVSLMLADIADGKLCTHNSAAQRQVVRLAFIRRMGLEPVLPGKKKRTDTSVIEECAPVVAARALRKRQAAFERRTSIAYVNQFAAPPGLRERIQASQADLLGSYEICQIDRFAVPDGLYRSRVETAQEAYGEQCLAGLGAGAAASFVGPIAWDPAAPAIPDPSPAVPRSGSSTQKGGRPPTRPGAPGLGDSVPDRQVAGGGGGGGAIAVVGLALAAALAFGRKK
jgi:hypothetical protein